MDKPAPTPTLEAASWTGPRHWRHWSEVPAAAWRWPNFRPEEVACRSDGSLLVDPAAMDCLQALRKALGRPVGIDSAYRTPEHNKAVGGSPNSQHLLGKAFDIRLSQEGERDLVVETALACGFRGIGQYDTFVHVDIGPSRTWDFRTERHQ